MNVPSSLMHGLESHYQAQLSRIKDGQRNLLNPKPCDGKKRPTQRAPDWWESARFHLCLRQGAGRHFAWLEVGSGKAALSCPTHQRSG